MTLLRTCSLLLLATSRVSALVATPVKEGRSQLLKENTVAPTDPTALLPLRIDGQWYDLQHYADKHKGGRWLLEYARGRDVTAIFHAIHLHGEQKARTILSTLPKLEDHEIRFPSRVGLTPSQIQSEGATQGPYVVAIDETMSRELPEIDSPLRRDLQAMLRRRFPNIESMKATPLHWVRTIIAAVLTLSCWAEWLHGNPAAIFLLPFAQWLLAAHTVHEATHGALSSNPRINYWAQFTSHPILFNVFVWIPQHILSHHQYTNDPQHDVDVHHFAPARLAKSQPPNVSENPKWNEGWTFVWKGCLTTLGTSILQPMRTLLEKPTPNFATNITPVPAAVSKQTLLISMLPSFFVLLYPLLAGVAGWMPMANAAFAEIWPWVGMSIIWTLMTQTSHIQEPCQFAEDSYMCWTGQQISTALDYSVGDPILTWATAGLNNQGLHHAMPTISSSHFAEMYEEYESICRKHGVEPRQTRDLGTASTELLDYVFKLNNPINSEEPK